METFGERLKSAREDRGLSIEAVAEMLDIGPEPLLALERDDFRALPDEAFVSKCLAAYAQCLDVDAGLMTADYLQERERCLSRLDAAVTQAVEVLPAAVQSPTGRPSMVPRLFAVAGIVAAIAFTASWMLSRDEAETTAPRIAAPATPVSNVANSTPPAPTPVSAATGSPTLTIAESGVGTGVKKRQLVGEGNRFIQGNKVWFWNRVEGGARGDSIEHVWYREGVEVARIPLEIGGSSWRTYSAKTLRGTAGDWSVEAVDPVGHVLQRHEFASTP